MAQSHIVLVDYLVLLWQHPIPSQPRPLEIVLRAEGHGKLEAETEGDKVCLGVPRTSQDTDLHAKTEEVLGRAARAGHPQRSGRKKVGRKATAVVSIIFLNSLKVYRGPGGRHVQGKGG